MKPSHLQTPRTLADCTFTQGYQSAYPNPHGESLWEVLAGYALAGATCGLLTGIGITGLMALFVELPLPRPGAALDLRVQFETETMDAAQQMLSGMREIMIEEGLPANRIVTEVSEDRGEVVHQIVKTAEKHGCDTVVVGRRGKSMIGQIFADSVAEQLVRHPIGMTIWLVE